MRELVTVDPGLDAAGVAFWEVPDGPVSTMPQMFAALKSVQRWRTKSEDPLQVRYAALAAKAQASGTQRVFVEKPAYAGVYAERMARQRGKGAMNAEAMGKLHGAIGALVGGFAMGGCTIELMPPGNIPKEMRQAKLRGLLERFESSLTLPAKERKLLTNSDVLDAVYLGIFHAIPSL